MNEADVRLINAYLDGELSQADRLSVERRLASDAVFSEQYKLFEQINQLVGESAASIDDEPLSEGLASALSLNPSDKTPSQPVSRPAGPGRKESKGRLTESVEPAHRPTPVKSNVVPLRGSRPGFRWMRILPMVASVSVLAVTLALLDFSGNDETGSKGISQQFAVALESEPSAMALPLGNDPGATLDIILSFQHSDGRWCREYFLNQSSQNVHGIACKTAGQWQPEVEQKIEKTGGDSSYQLADASDTDAIVEFVDQHAQTDPIDRLQEISLIEQAWP